MKKAFTLAEVLITLSIIGVISVLTVPSMIKNYQNNLYSVSLKKAVAEINDALGQLVIDEHARNNSLWNTTLRNYPTNCTDGEEHGPCIFYKKYFKAIQTCNSNDGQCMAMSYTTKDGTDAGKAYLEDDDNYYCVKVNSGYSFCTFKDVFLLDTNGPSDPNIVGIDLFGVHLGSTPKLIDTTETEYCGKNIEEYNGMAFDFVHGCLTKVIKNGWVID